MKGVLMNRTAYIKPFVCAPRINKSMGAFGMIVSAFIIMLIAIYIPETKVIGQGLDYNLIP